MTSNRSSVTVKRESKYLKRGGKNHTIFFKLINHFGSSPLSFSSPVLVSLIQCYALYCVLLFNKGKRSLDIG